MEIGNINNAAPVQGYVRLHQPSLMVHRGFFKRHVQQCRPLFASSGAYIQSFIIHRGRRFVKAMFAVFRVIRFRSCAASQVQLATSPFTFSTKKRGPRSSLLIRYAFLDLMELRDSGESPVLSHKQTGEYRPLQSGCAIIIVPLMPSPQWEQSRESARHLSSLQHIYSWHPTRLVR